MKVCNHGEFGLYLMPAGDAVLWSVLGIILGAILIYIWVRYCGDR